MRKILNILLLFPLLLFAQDKNQPENSEVKITLDDKNLVRDGNDLFRQNKFVDAEVKYKKALESTPNYEKANFNLGNAIYEQNRFKEATPYYELITKTATDKQIKADAFHNLGNVNMVQKQYAQAVEAYKNSLRQNSKDEDTRYNLALAKELLEQQEQQNKDDKNKDKKDKDKKDQQDKNNQNKDQNKEKDKENKDQENKNDQKQENKQQPKPNQLSKQQKEQLLEAMNKEENKTQKKVNAKKAKGRKVKQEKDW